MARLALLIVERILPWWRMIPASASRRSTSCSPKAATATGSKPAKAARKFSRLRRIVSHDSPAWNPSRQSFSNNRWSSVIAEAPFSVVVRHVLGRRGAPASTAVCRRHPRRGPSCQSSVVGSELGRMAAIESGSGDADLGEDQTIDPALCHLEPDRVLGVEEVVVPPLVDGAEERRCRRRAPHRPRRGTRRAAGDPTTR